MYRIHLSNLSQEASKVELLSYFSKFGPITSVKIVRDRQKMCKGHGKVIAKNEACFHNILRSKHFISGNEILVEPFLKGKQLIHKELRVLTRQVAVYGNEIEKIPIPRFHSALSKFGLIESIEFPQKAQQTETAVVIFKTSKSAQLCLEAEETTISNIVLRFRPYKIKQRILLDKKLNNSGISNVIKAVEEASGPKKSSTAELGDKLKNPPTGQESFDIILSKLSVIKAPLDYNHAVGSVVLRRAPVRRALYRRVCFF